MEGNQQTSSPVPAEPPIAPTAHRNLMDFSQALRAVLAGKKIERLQWANDGIREVYGVMDKEILKIYQGRLDNWIISEADMIATDWMTVIEGEKINVRLSDAPNNPQ